MMIFDPTRICFSFRILEIIINSVCVSTYASVYVQAGEQLLWSTDEQAGREVLSLAELPY